LAKKFQFDYIEVSAKTSMNIKFMFEMLAKNMIKNCEVVDQKRKTKKKNEYRNSKSMQFIKSNKKADGDGGCKC
jgi:hypothetical protein